jgi:hypothetical protein
MADPKKGTGKKPKGSGRRLYTDENPCPLYRLKFLRLCLFLGLDLTLCPIDVLFFGPGTCSL